MYLKSIFAVLLVNAMIMLPAHAGKASDCAAEADYYSRSSGSTMGTAAKGAGVGLLFGGIVGDSSDAGKGALIGGIIGGLKKSNDKEKIYQDTYRRCMQRGY